MKSQLLQYILYEEINNERSQFIISSDKTVKCSLRNACEESANEPFTLLWRSEGQGDAGRKAIQADKQHERVDRNYCSWQRVVGLAQLETGFFT